MSPRRCVLRASISVLVLALVCGAARRASAQCPTAQFGGVGNSVTFVGSVGTGLGDFNNDGVLDLVTIDPVGGNSPALLLGDGAGGFGPPTTFPIRSDFPVPTSILVADVNGDGKP